jgi:hypothetical protein
MAPRRRDARRLGRYHSCRRTLQRRSHELSSRRNSADYRGTAAIIRARCFVSLGCELTQCFPLALPSVAELYSLALNFATLPSAYKLHSIRRNEEINHGKVEEHDRQRRRTETCVWSRTRETEGWRRASKENANRLRSTNGLIEAEKRLKTLPKYSLQFYLLPRCSLWQPASSRLAESAEAMLCRRDGLGCRRSRLRFFSIELSWESISS